MESNAARVEKLGRSLKKALIELKEEAAVDIFEGLVKDLSWSKHVRGDTIERCGVEPQAKRAEKISCHDRWAVQ